MTDAQYHEEIQDEDLLKKYIKLAKKLNKKIICLPRNKKQSERYLLLKCENFDVSDKPFALNDIASACELFLGAGGTMTRELACLNVPTISFFEKKKLHVDRILQKANLLKYDQELEQIDSFININREFINIESNLDTIILQSIKKYLKN